VSGLWRRTRNILVHRILHADDSPHRIALGTAIAVGVAFLPTLGHTVLALTLAAIARANKAVTVPMVWVANPATFVPMYGTGWWLGRILLRRGSNGGAGAAPHSLALPPEYSGWGMFRHVHEAGFWRYLANATLSLGAELWLGCAILGLAAGVVSYFLCRWGIVAYRTRRAADAHRGQPLRPAIPPHRDPVGHPESVVSD